MPKEYSNPMMQEYLQKASNILGEVLEHFVIAGLPKLTPDQEETGALVHPIMKAEGHPGLLCMVADQTAVEMHKVRLELDCEEDGSDTTFG
jgi:hypothetical protein